MPARVKFRGKAYKGIDWLNDKGASHTRKLGDGIRRLGLALQ